jgi:imidazolonepropionase-like amidohydrolase
MGLKQLARDPAYKDKYADFKCAGMAATIEGGWPTPVLELEFKEKPKIVRFIILHFSGASAKSGSLTSFPQLKMAEDNLPKLRVPDDAEPYVQTQISKYGASYIKLMHELGDAFNMELPEPPHNVQKAVVDAAHKNGLIAVGHAFSYSGAMGLLSSGVDGLTHVFIDRAPSSDWIELMKRNKAHLCPTLACCASQAGEGDQIEVAFSNDPFSQRMLFDKRARKNIGFAAKNSKANFANAVLNGRDAHKAGIPILVGSDCAGEEIGTAYGMGVHVEMYLLFKEIGLTPVEVLKSATSTTADRFVFHDRGRIAVGKKADMVLIEGDVREAIADLECRCLPISCVWRDGVSASIFQTS